MAAPRLLAIATDGSTSIHIPIETNTTGAEGKVVATNSAGIIDIGLIDPNVQSARIGAFNPVLSVGTWNSGTKTRTFFVNPVTGDDNGGLGTAVAPYKTIQKACDIAALMDYVSKSNVIISTTSGALDAFIVKGRSPGIEGPINYVITGVDTIGSSSITVTGANNAVTIQGLATVTVMNLGLIGVTGKGIQCIEPGTHCVIGAGMVFGAFPGGIHMNAGRQGTIELNSSYTISGGAASHLSSSNHGLIFVSASLTITLSGTPNFTGSFVNCSQGSAITGMGSVTFSGSATGPRFLVTGNSYLDGPIATFPGDVAGTIDTPLSVSLDKGTVSSGTVTFTAAVPFNQKLTVGGNLTIATGSWKSAPNYTEFQLEIVNGGAFTITWPTLSWMDPDGSGVITVGTTPSRSLKTSGTDFIRLWSSDGGTTRYAKMM